MTKPKTTARKPAAKPAAKPDAAKTTPAGPVSAPEPPPAADHDGISYHPDNDAGTTKEASDAATR